MYTRAVRGATTVSENDAVEIINETRKLLEELCNVNGFLQEDIASAVFTVTKDLDAAFPAVAARQMGWNNVALMCMNEIDVPGSLSKCIRVMLHVNTEKGNSEMKYVYMNGAKVLRPDLDTQ